MKAKFSSHLDAIEPAIRELIQLLAKEYEYVSVLSTDSVGFQIAISQRSKSVSNENMTTERGNVVRVYRDGRYSEAAFNEIDLLDVQPTFRAIKEELEAQFALLAQAGVEIYETPILPDEPEELFIEKETGQLPEEADIRALVTKFQELSDRGMKEIPGAMDCMIRAGSTHVSKMFLTANRRLKQSYVHSEAFAASYAADESGKTRFPYEGVAGLGGPEIFEGLEEKVAELPRGMRDLLSAEEVVPGEYEIITAPDVSGLIAHEAFGHGVEMDMFVKGRALGAKYIGKRVGSDLVTMHEGARYGESVSSYAFDDEGTPAGDVIEIDRGILRTGVCDALSALRLKVAPTGNGKREKYSHKVYTRMTNTVFAGGKDSLEEMIASVKKGYLLRGMESGMEDPKHWGIQCMLSRGYEIIDGKLTGKVVAPVIMTGYVPDLLGNISMAGPDVEFFGNGYCGKGHKEWVKTSDGGPYLKTRARLG